MSYGSIYLKIKGRGFNWSHLCTGAVCCFLQEGLDRAAHVVIATMVEQGVLCYLRSWLENAHLRSTSDLKTYNIHTC